MRLGLGRQPRLDRFLGSRCGALGERLDGRRLRLSGRCGGELPRRGGRELRRRPGEATTATRACDREDHRGAGDGKKKEEDCIEDREDAGMHVRWRPR